MLLAVDKGHRGQLVRFLQGCSGALPPYDTEGYLSSSALAIRVSRKAMSAAADAPGTLRP